MNNKTIITGLTVTSIASLFIALLIWLDRERERKEKEEARQAARQNGKVARNTMAELSKQEDQRQELEDMLKETAERTEERPVVGFETPSKKELEKNS